MSVAVPVKKIRKKSDNKPQSQVNKCNNEKRRRELENDTINQLEELLGACLSDVRQPDKNGIVQEAAAQIRRVLEHRRAAAAACCTACPSACLRGCLRPAPLQHGDVSSSHPSSHSEIKALVEALKHYTTTLGWVLLEINCDGDIECVTENIKDIVRYERSELYHQSIYNYLHHGDHLKFAPILQNNTTVGCWPRADSPPGRRLRAVRSRLRIKPEPAEDGELYRDVLISAALVREVEHSSSVLCVIRREEDASNVAALDSPMTPRPLHQLTFKLDLQGKILLFESRHRGNLGLEGRRLQELVHSGDLARVAEHLRGAASTSGPVAGAPVRLCLYPDTGRPFLVAKPHSRFFRGNPITEVGQPPQQDFIMSTFTILTDSEVSLLDAGNVVIPSVGGPLMTSAVMNGSAGPRNGQFPPSPASEPSFSFGPSDFEIDYFPQGSWSDVGRGSPSTGFSVFPFDQMPIEEPRPQEDRMAGSIPGSGPPTPRTPHTPAGPAPPLPPPSAPTPPAPEPDSARLRNLLSKRESPATTPTPADHPATAPATPATPAAPSTPAGNNLILKGLLNQEDEEEAQRTGPVAPDGPPPPTPPQHQRPQGNNMLLRLLAEKSDEEDPEQRGNRSRSELLSQLLKESTAGAGGAGGPAPGTPGPAAGPASEPPTPQPNSGEELLQLLGIGGQRSALKRKLMQEEQNIKRPHSTDPHQVTSSGPAGAGAGPGNGKGLWEKNKMLASLLSTPIRPPPMALPGPHAQRPFQPPAQPSRHGAPYPPSQAQLAQLLSNNKSYENNAGGTTGLSPLQQMLQGHRAASVAGNSAGEYRPGYMGDATSDPLLSEILDQVMDIVPENYTQDSSELMNLINSIEQPGQQPAQNHHHNSYQVMNEKMAINAIQKSLMQCESAVKSPSSPGVPPAYPNTTQAGTNQWAGRYTPQSQPGNHQQQAQQQQAQQQQAQQQQAQQQQAQQQQAQQQQAQQQQQQHQQAQQRQKAQIAQQQQAQKARLLQQQQQQMVVGSVGGGGLPAPLHASMDALLNAPTPPNVSLQRAADAPPYPTPPPHYHHHHHHHGSAGGGFQGPGTPGQEAPPYKLSLQQQQNPMLNTQSAYSGQRGSPLAPHTPLTPHAPLSPYLQQPQQPPPRLQRHLSHPAPPMQVGSGVGGYYGGGAAEGGYCEAAPLFPRQQHPPHALHHNHMSGMTSEYVRQELRAVVGARNGAGGARPPDLLQPSPELDALAMSFDMSPAGGVVGAGAGQAPAGTPKPWDTHQNTPSTMEEVRGGDHKSSLLQKLLTE